jgi:hypothetical protein
LTQAELGLLAEAQEAVDVPLDLLDLLLMSRDTGNSSFSGSARSVTEEPRTVSEKHSNAPRKLVVDLNRMLD